MSREHMADAGPRRPVSRVEQGLAWLFGAGPLATHLDLWGGRGEGLVAGLLPRELVDRLVWMAFAWLYLVWFCARIWRDEDDA